MSLRITRLVAPSWQVGQVGHLTLSPHSRRDSSRCVPGLPAKTTSIPSSRLSGKSSQWEFGPQDSLSKTVPLTPSLKYRQCIPLVARRRAACQTGGLYLILSFLSMKLADRECKWQVEGAGQMHIAPSRVHKHPPCLTACCQP